MNETIEEILDINFNETVIDYWKHFNDDIELDRNFDLELPILSKFQDLIKSIDDYGRQCFQAGQSKTWNRDRMEWIDDYTTYDEYLNQI